eukprot:TRINITY_DN4135_c0_g1_i2.p2 TRINITY_DN4135_c0_g1~~TRINITY_DN4135_c0_g1_i2.p2  ORF type:complete len:351 (+),score=56.40 TRINITY_DN4135_c0_g1_i2:3-1055(+)
MVLLLVGLCASAIAQPLPVILGTWERNHVLATEAAWQELASGGSLIDAIVTGLRTCQDLQCDYTVGWGGSQSELGETYLDAMIFDGPRNDIGIVAGLRRVKDAIGVARAVLDHTTHTMLVGDMATRFAIQMGFREEPLFSAATIEAQQAWQARGCQPNFWQNVSPDPSTSCGPYTPLPMENRTAKPRLTPRQPFRSLDTAPVSHDTICENGDIVAGTSTNGATNKIDGRVGDAPIPGAGAFVDNDVGAAVGTGDGDQMMRFAPAARAVEMMKNGASPQQACETMIAYIARFYPSYFGAMICVNKAGEHGAACNDTPSYAFPYTVRTSNMTEPAIFRSPCQWYGGEPRLQA